MGSAVFLRADDCRLCGRPLSIREAIEGRSTHGACAAEMIRKGWRDWKAARSKVRGPLPETTDV